MSEDQEFTEAVMALAVVSGELAELRGRLGALAEWANDKLNDEYHDRQYIAEHLVDRLEVLAGGGQ